MIYNVSIFLYHVAIKLASFFNPKAKLWIDGRKNIFQKLKQNFNDNNAQVYWFHAASLGEFEQGRPLIEKIKKQYPNIKILLTFFSPSGYEIRKNYELADFIFYLPIDYKANAVKFLQIVKPKKIFFIKYEFWHNYLFQANKLNIPVYLISGIFRENQLFSKPYGKFHRKVLSNFTYFFVQNKKSKDLLKSISYTNVMITGDTRFDRVKDIANNSKDILPAYNFTRNNISLVVGSSWPADEDIIFKFMEKHKGLLKVILAPHEVNNANINRITNKTSVKSIKFSQAGIDTVSQYDMLIIDNVGMLSSLYKYGNLAYVGGGFGAGIHNVLEASVYGIPVLFGPKYQKFDEAVNLIKKNAAFSIKSYAEFETIMLKLISDSSLSNKCGQNALKYMNDNFGACDKIMKFIFD